MPTAIEWYDPQGQLVSNSSGDEVNQFGAGGIRSATLTFKSYQESQGGKYECRVTGPGNYSEKLPVCIGKCYTLDGYILCNCIRVLFQWLQTAQVSTRCAHILYRPG